MEPKTFESQPASYVFIGGGQMAIALIAGLLNAGVSPGAIAVVEPNANQRENLRTRLGVDTYAAPDEWLKPAKVIVWAVKPQLIWEATQQAKSHLGDSLHISIAAGVRCADLSQWLGSSRIVRAMPNTSALIGESVTGLTATQGASDADRQLAEQVLGSVGFCLWVETDERLNAVTAVSGSGPAYLFHFLEGFQAAAQAVGFDPATARELVLRTAAGAVRQAHSGESFRLMRERVTSKNGTTEAALAHLDSAGTAAALGIAVSAAYKRADALSSELQAVL